MSYNSVRQRFKRWRWLVGASDDNNGGGGGPSVCGPQIFDYSQPCMIIWF